MKRQLAWALALGALVTAGSVGLASAREKPVVVRAGKLILRVNGGVTPRILPKRKPAPISFHGNGNLSTVDGSHPPALNEVTFDADRNVYIDVLGLPACRKYQLVARDSRGVKRACGRSILGEGNAVVRVAFPDQTPFKATGPLLLFNGGQKGRVTRLYLHTYVAVPTPTAVVADVKIRRTHGRLGNHMIFSVPVIAGGYGSVVHTDIRGGRMYSYRGKRRSFVSARCPDGKLLARGTFRFRDGTALSGGIVRRCRGRG